MKFRLLLINLFFIAAMYCRGQEKDILRLFDAHDILYFNRLADSFYVSGEFKLPGEDQIISQPRKLYTDQDRASLLNQAKHIISGFENPRLIREKFPFAFAQLQAEYYTLSVITSIRSTRQAIDNRPLLSALDTIMEFSKDTLSAVEKRRLEAEVGIRWETIEVKKQALHAFATALSSKMTDHGIDSSDARIEVPSDILIPKSNPGAKPPPPPTPDVPYPEITSGPRTDFQSRSFPMPPPQASCRSTPLKLNGNPKTLAEANRLLINGLFKAQYSSFDYYAVDGGFALVTPLEQLKNDAAPKGDPPRWDVKVDVRSDFSWSNYLNALFFGEKGYYRIIAFIITDRPFAFNKDGKGTDIRKVGPGFNQLPAEVGALEYTSQHSCTVLIYEFQKTSKGEAANFVIKSRYNVQDHLKKTLAWDSIFSR